MYQLPVENLERIRKPRKSVKNILYNIGLDSCKVLLEELQNSDTNDKSFHDTEWVDFTDGFNGKRRKKWRYRSQALCCNLCRFSARTWNGYRNHIQRWHARALNLGQLANCPVCAFVGHPKVLARHLRIFHGTSAKSVMHGPASTSTPMVTGAGNVDRYTCRRCAYQDSLLYCMKKHILVNHYVSLLDRYFGQRTEREQNGSSPKGSKFYCKVCLLCAESSEHLIYHILSSDKHKELDVHISTLVYEHPKSAKKLLPSLAPKAMQQPVYRTSLVHAKNDHQPVKTLALQRSDAGPITSATLSGTILHGTHQNTTTLVCAPGTNQAFLPAQASALVQLASAEAKGLLRPGSVMAAHQNVQPTRGIVATLPTTVGLASSLAVNSVGASLSTISQNAPKPLPIAVGVPAQPQSRQVLLPPGVQVNVQGSIGLRAPGPPPLLVTQRLPLNQPPPRGTMLTSQSLLSHLIPTGNKVNGLPTYTLAPLQVTMPVQSGNIQTIAKGAVPAVAGNPTVLPPPDKIAESNLISPPASKEAKKWITCPICNELFPSNVYQVHIEVAHKASSKSKLQGLAARAPFLKKMPDKTIKCLMCKILLSEKGLFEHLLHGLNCLYCPGMFYSIKQLIEHTNTEHTPSQKASCDFMRREYRLYTDDHGNLLFPYFDINTTAPKELLGDHELNLALVTGSLDLIFLKMFPASVQPVCRSVVKTTSTDCPFCSEKLRSEDAYHEHLKLKHCIMPTIHAILKTPAFKCIYCSGVYTGKTTPKAISIHVQRCRCAPKTAKDVERLINPDPKNQTSLTVNKTDQRLPLVTRPRGSTVTPAQQSPEKESDRQNKLRLEMAIREAMEANRRERDARAAKRQRVEPPRNAVQPDLSLPLALDPTGVERHSFDERKDFLTEYFNRKPYLSRQEAETLASRLWLHKGDVAWHFGSKRARCMKAIRKSRVAILLGFNMAELKKVKHDLLIPEAVSEKTAA
ncbi:activity-dependent neuroprotector homeobox protein 2b [Brienomyrus brachyistius]|uniref:activity-dependent neuroprotector homeobox protein 2b n=1 Tax=Brienomyrus brachyistius TaxID=42636 RepID=UPI0020B44162|nr:activity-dependent neuroprotector homeobox protein 2b [Brienomyrus brachyistius]XP_048849156.1 activity-dependent neuroprotector homeobox protein 2b [Brienomyrus brachyistius]XP_048849157.1 activity-dependent neuroprotector homeobox protein 2b [Brienomyrus brachyistius]